MWMVRLGLPMFFALLILKINQLFIPCNYTMQERLLWVMSDENVTFQFLRFSIYLSFNSWYPSSSLLILPISRSGLETACCYLACFTSQFLVFCVVLNVNDVSTRSRTFDEKRANSKVPLHAWNVFITALYNRLLLNSVSSAPTINFKLLPIITNSEETQHR